MRGLWRQRPLAWPLVALVLAGCGSTTHTILPPAPPGAGKGSVTLGLQWSPGRLSMPSFQMGVYAGVGARGVLGGTVTNVFIPSSFSGAVYTTSGDGWASARAHVQNFLGEQAGPILEVEGAYAPASGGAALRAGVGIVGDAPVTRVIRRNVEGTLPAPPPRVVLTLGADVLAGRALVSGEAHVGLKRALARNQIARQRQDLDRLTDLVGGAVLDSSVVASVTGGESVMFGFLKARLRNGREITVASRDPFPDCFSCGYDLRRVGAYPPLPEARPVWVTLTGATRSPVVAIAALDPNAILATWRERGVLDLRLPPDAADRAASGVPLWHDLSVLGGLARGDGPGFE